MFLAFLFKIMVVYTNWKHCSASSFAERRLESNLLDLLRVNVPSFQDYTIRIKLQL